MFSQYLRDEARGADLREQAQPGRGRDADEGEVPSQGPFSGSVKTLMKAAPENPRGPEYQNLPDRQE